MSEQKDSAESELATYGNVLGSSSERRIFFSEVQDRTVKVLHALLSGSNTRDIGFDTHLPSARFHDECLRLREILRKGRLCNAGQTAENSKVIISYKGEELHGTVMRIDNDNDKYYFDIEKSDKPSDRESDFVIRNFGTDTFKHSVGTVFEHEGRSYLALVTEDGQFDLLKGLSKSDVTMVPDTERLRSLIKQNRSYKVPVFANNEIFESLVAKYLDEDWLQPCLALVTEVSGILKSAVTEVIQNDLQIASFPRMRRLLLARIEHEIDVFVEEATVEVAHFVRREKTPYTQNHYLNETLSSRRAQRFLDVAKAALEDSTRDDRSYDKKEIELLLKDVVRSMENKSIEEHMAEDMEDALRAYGKVAYKRFIDGIPMICGDKMLHFPEKIRHSLAKASDDELEKVLSLSAADMERRKTLQHKVQELEKGLKILKDLR